VVLIIAVIEFFVDIGGFYAIQKYGLWVAWWLVLLNDY